MDTHLRVLSDSYPMNTNMTWVLDDFQKYFCPTKVASAFEGLTCSTLEGIPVVFCLFVESKEVFQRFHSYKTLDRVNDGKNLTFGLQTSDLQYFINPQL